MMRCDFPVWVFVLVFSSACAARDFQSRDECGIYRFEEGIEVEIRESFIKTLDMLLEQGAPDTLASIKLNLFGVSEIGLPVPVKEVHLSAFFRPLDTGQVECQSVEGTEYVRCYKGLSGFPLQLAAVFRAEGDSGVVSVMDQLSYWARDEALDCE